MKSGYLTYAAGISLFVLALFWWSVAGQDPSSVYPLPLLVLIPALLGLRQLAVVLPVILFFLWNAELIKGATEIPKRTFTLLIVSTALDVVWLAVASRDGMAMQGAKYTYLVCAVNISWIIVLWLLFLRGRKATPTFKVNLLFHWILFMWLAWYAFPFFGELP